MQRTVEPQRRELRAQTVATVRYGTAPGPQLQIDFGNTAVPVGDEVRRVRLFSCHARLQPALLRLAVPARAPLRTLDPPLHHAVFGRDNIGS